jgi:predicted nicotinamide N-methyase
MALDHGMSLRDASAYNIQFHKGRPILIDTLSFEILPEGKPWIAYRQFCQHFLAPLALMSYRDIRMGLLLRDHIDGVPLDLAAEMLPFRARFRIPLFLHVFLHAKSQKRHADKGTPGGSSGKETRSRPFTMQAFRGVIESLRSGVDKMKLKKADSTWVDYYAEAAHYTSEAIDNKKELVAAFLEQASPSTVWDLGANTGLFSRIAAEHGSQTVAFEMDPTCVEESYRRVKANGEDKVLPLVCDLTNPSPSLGWANEERMTLEERGPADAILALALIHHLAIANNVPLNRIADYFATLGTRLIIEFVPKSDEKVQHLLSSREDIFVNYTRDGFEQAFKERFETERAEEIKGSERVLYLMRVR